MRLAAALPFAGRLPRRDVPRFRPAAFLRDPDLALRLRVAVVAARALFRVVDFRFARFFLRVFFAILRASVCVAAVCSPIPAMVSFGIVGITFSRIVFRLHATTLAATCAGQVSLTGPMTFRCRFRASRALRVANSIC